MTIEQIVRWFQDVDIYTFGSVYGKSIYDCEGNVYIREKYTKMQENPIAWMGSLDSFNQNKLEQLIKSKEIK